MPQTVVETNERMSLRISAKEKAFLMRAATLENSNLTEFVVRTVVSAAHKVIEKHDQILLSERDSLYLLKLLENPPQPNKKLLEAAFKLPRTV